MTNKPFIKFRIMMKYTLVCTALLFTITANAQKWHFGAKLDANYSTVQGKGIKDKYSAGFQIGGFAEYNINKQWAVQPELLYTWSQYKKASNFSTYYNNYGRSSADENINLAYVSVPILAKYNLNNTISFLAGPQASYLIYADENLLKNDNNAFTNFELSANIGVQVNIEKVGFYARFNKGLTDINNIDERYKWKSSHIQVGIAVRIM